MSASTGAFQAQQSSRMGYLLAAKEYARMAYDKMVSTTAGAFNRVMSSSAVMAGTAKARSFFTRAGVRQAAVRAGAAAKALAFAAVAKGKALAVKLGLGSVHAVVSVVLGNKVFAAVLLTLNAWKVGLLDDVSRFIFKVLRKASNLAGNGVAKVENQLHVEEPTTRAHTMRNRASDWIASARQGSGRLFTIALDKIEGLFVVVLDPEGGNKAVRVVLNTATFIANLVLMVRMVMVDLYISVALFAVAAVAYVLDRFWLTPWIGNAKARRAKGARAAGRAASYLAGSLSKRFVQFVTVVSEFIQTVPFISTDKVKVQQDEPVAGKEDSSETPTPAEVFENKPQGKSRPAAERPKGRPTPKQPNQARRARQQKEKLRKASEEFARDAEAAQKTAGSKGHAKV